MNFLINSEGCPRRPLFPRAPFVRELFYNVHIRKSRLSAVADALALKNDISNAAVALNRWIMETSTFYFPGLTHEPVQENKKVDDFIFPPRERPKVGATRTLGVKARN